MSDRQWFVMAHEEARRRAIQAVQNAPDGYVVEVKPKTRSLAANAKLWAMLTEVGNQVVWHGRRLSPECWKHIFSSALKKQEVVPNLDGTGFVVLGQSTSQMTVREMGDLIELITAFGAERGVQFADMAAA